ncbi:MAG TPA: T9SS type A sorting domain-containing protein, partial [Chitinophagales bacterium]|nr:T9SS type A sorting domain-containing protein [Chitinophagales bacterium]
VQQTKDGGYIIAGYSESSDGDVSGNNGARDYWIVKADTGGNLIWEAVLGGSSYDEARSVQQLSDGGYIVAGFAGSSDGDVSGNHGVYDYWIVKLDTGGNSLWKFCFGGTFVDQPFSIQQTKDDGFVVVGQSNSVNGDVSGNHGGYDFWVVKLDTAANLIWQKSLGGSNDEYGPYAVQQTNDGGFIIAGASLSNNDDVSGNHGGSFYGDCWVVKLEGDIPTVISSLSNNFISVYPNPVQTQLTLNSAMPVNESTIRVYNLQGKIIELPTTFLAVSASGGTKTQAQLNTASLADGFYMLRISNIKTGECEVRKFVKQ